MYKEYSSFLSKCLQSLLGDLYEEVYSVSVKYFKIYTTILIVIAVLSFCCHWVFVSKLLSLTTGSSLLFILYLITVLMVIDQAISYKLSKISSSEMLSTAIGIILIAMAVSLGFLTNRWSNHYAFQCNTFYVDEETRLYHIFRDCEDVESNESFVEMKGYEIEQEEYGLCMWCEEYAETLEDTYRADRYSRR